MKCFSILAGAVLIAAMTGCSGDGGDSVAPENPAPQADATNTSTDSATETATDSEASESVVQLVVFNVPDMH